MKKQKKERKGSNLSAQTAASLNLMSNYVDALQMGDLERMTSLLSPDFIQDHVAGDAYLDRPKRNPDVLKFWESWFHAFSEMDVEVKRTIVTEDVVVLEFTFTGTNTGGFDLEVFGREVQSTGRTIQLRGASVYEIMNGLIQKETLYVDMATIWVELGEV